MTELLQVPAEAFAGMAAASLLCIAIPIAAAIFWKKKHKNTSLITLLAGAVTFTVFAMILEQLLHMVMLPVVSGSSVLYVIYGALAAGVFEETGRFVTFKLFLKKTTAGGDPDNAVMFGIGHGGTEAVLLIGVTMGLSYIPMCAMANSGMLTPEMIGDEATYETVVTQINLLAGYSFFDFMTMVLERVLAIAAHIAMSVFVFRAANDRKRLWMFPATILVHVLIDVPAAMFQVGVLPLWVAHIGLVVCDVIMVIAAVRIYKAMKAEMKQ